MGLIIRDTITLDSGLQVTNAYANIGREDIHINKLDMVVSHNPQQLIQYLYSTRINIWANQDAASQENGGRILKSYIVSTHRESNDPYSENIYSLMYTSFKKMYGFTCEDII